jgi:hypothetical protein
MEGEFMRIILLVISLLSMNAYAVPDVVPTQANESSGASFDREYATTIGTGTVGAGSTQQVIQAVGNAARVGDIIRFTSAGPNYLVESHVNSITTNSIGLTRAIPALPTTGDSFTILRLLSPSVQTDGSVNISGSIVSSNPSIGTNGSAIPTSSTQIGAKDGSGNLQPLKVDGSGSLITSSSTTTVKTATGSNQNLGATACTALTGSYATISTPAFNVCILQIFNSCDQTIVISIDGGTTAFLQLEAREATSIDWCTNGLFITSGTAIKAKHNGVVPTLGNLRISSAG